jgi:hypothetical protein
LEPATFFLIRVISVCRTKTKLRALRDGAALASKKLWS